MGWDPNSCRRTIDQVGEQGCCRPGGLIREQNLCCCRSCSPRSSAVEHEGRIEPMKWATCVHVLQTPSLAG